MGLRVVFMGTPAFAVPSLVALDKAFDVSLVVTRPDAVRGRGHALVPSAVKSCAKELGLPVLEAKRIGPGQLEAIRGAAPDVVAVAAFGAILPDELVGTGIACFGSVNVHGSLLPRWRGAAPIQRAILAGDTRLGISIMRVVHDLDAGPWCRQASIETDSLGAEEVMARLADLGAQELVAALKGLSSGTLVWHEQDEAHVSYAKKIEKSEMLLRTKEPALINLRRIRAATDAAPARFIVGKHGVRALSAQLVPPEDVAAKALAAGQLLFERGRVLLGCGDGALELLSVKPDGKRAMSASAWATGVHSALNWREA